MKNIEKNSVLMAYFKVEDYLYGSGKDKSLEIKASMAWGALQVVYNNGHISWEEMKSLFGEFMSKQLNLR